MGASAPRGYRGPPLPVPITDLLKALQRHGFQCTATGGGKTIAVSRSGRRCGYVKPYVIRSEGSLGYYLGPLGIEGQQCPARQVSPVVKQFCRRYACSRSDLIVHPLGGTNSGTSLLIIRNPELALSVLLQDAGNAADEPCMGGQTSLNAALKAFSHRHGLEYQAGKSPDGLAEVSVYSYKKVYRYAFARWWKPQGPLVLWVGVNPGTGDTEKRRRPTLERCIARSKELGAAGLMFANLFAARASKPSGLRAISDPVGPHNDEALRELSKLARWTIAAWGQQGRCGRQRAAHVRTLLRQPQCLGVTITGDPRHPLYVSAATALKPWRAGRTFRTPSPGQPRALTGGFAVT